MSSITSHGEIASHPTETYGTGPQILRTGNGGAGATGLIAALANDYLSTLTRPASITWVCNHSRNTQLALLNGYIDIALTYERDQEAISVREGWAVSAGCMFHDHFCLAGPVGDPAEIAGLELGDTFRKIAERKARFLARADGSATMIKERSIWAMAGLQPWVDGQEWYVKTVYSPAEAIRAAAETGAYLLTDRSTLLKQVSEGAVEGMTVFVEPEDGGSMLMNSCFALYDSRATSEVKEQAQRFLEYVLSERGQQVISQFGKMEAGLPLFAAVGMGYARQGLVGGQARGQKWTRV